jgi:hypothetical protein
MSKETIKGYMTDHVGLCIVCKVGYSLPRPGGTLW